jgi:signal transduction histidine kinase
LAHKATQSWQFKYGLALVLASAVVVSAPWLQPLGPQRLFFLASAVVLLSTVYGGFGPGLAATVVAFFGSLWFVVPSAPAGLPRWEDLLPVIMFLPLLVLVVLLASFGFRSLSHTQAMKRELEQRLAIFENTNRSLKQELADREKAEDDRIHLAQKVRSSLERAYQQKSERLTSLDKLLSLGKIGLAVLDHPFHYVCVNEFFSTLAGVPHEELVGRSAHETTPKLYAIMDPLLRRVVKSGEPATSQSFSAELALGRPVGSWLITCFPMKGEFGIVVMDVTEWKQAQDLVAKHAQELAGSHAKLERLAYMAFYDLKKPLQTITSNLKVLTQRYRKKLDADAEHLLEQTADGVRQMESLTSQLLSTVQTDTDTRNIGPIDIENVLKWSLHNLESHIAQTGAVVTHDPAPTIAGNATDLIHLFQSVIGYAIKSKSRTAPRIHLSSRFRTRTEDHVPEWVFSVKDNGMAIDPRAVDRIFLVYEGIISGNQDTETGFALGSCKKIVDDAGGRIWVEFQPGMGSVLYFSLPQQPD